MNVAGLAVGGKTRREKHVVDAQPEPTAKATLPIIPPGKLSGCLGVLAKTVGEAER